MKLTMRLADTVIGINLLGQANQVAHLCRKYFKDFLCPVQSTEAEIKISIHKNLNTCSPDKGDGRNRGFAIPLTFQEVTAWLSIASRFKDDFAITEATISLFFLDGLLLFNPDTADGRIYLLREGIGCFRSIYKLFWIYLAQVLGEQKGCFVHSAALVRDEKGYLFLGDSGAGKSSVARICGKSKLFSDDSPVFCKRGSEYLVFPSPYHQLNGPQGLDKGVVDQCAKVEGFYFLFKDQRTYRENMSKKEAVSLIVNRHILFFQFLSVRARLLLFDLFLDACDKIPSYIFHLCLDEDIWATIDSYDRRLT